MKDPCEECLVSVCCAEICDKKRNHNALCQDALKYYKTNKRNRTGFNSNVAIRYNEQYRKAKEKDMETFRTTNEILKRKLQIC
jgi:hypothetical protein